MGALLRIPKKGDNFLYFVTETSKVGSGKGGIEDEFTFCHSEMVSHSLATFNKDVFIEQLTFHKNIAGICKVASPPTLLYTKTVT